MIITNFPSDVFKILQLSCANAELLNIRKLQQPLRYNTGKERICN